METRLVQLRGSIFVVTGQFVADYSSHGQFVARLFVAWTIRRKAIRRMDNSSQGYSSHGQFVAEIIRRDCVNQLLCILNYWLNQELQ